MIDDAYPETVPQYRQAIAELGGGDIDFVINTHWHFDHADGNKRLGADGVWFVSHENSRDMMTQDNRIDVLREVFEQPAYPVEGWPVITYDETLRMHFNGERMELLHVAPAHTAGDTAVIFSDRNLVHMGDVYITVGYPFLDVDHGGSLSGMIAFCEQVLDRLQPGAVVVPGHGSVSSYGQLLDYVLMLRTVRDRISSLIASGATLDQVKAARLTSEWDDALGDPSNFLTWAYRSVTANGTAADSTPTGR
jgi:glyoxylase-like metal-dependent hydrolase (beta-lactamase superfamily II)